MTRESAAERAVPAPPAAVYAAIADYQHRHPQIMPVLFGPLMVRRGGTGAGTEFEIELRRPGPNRRLRMRVDEPEPGRVLTETDLDSGAVVAFTVIPRETGSLARISGPGPRVIFRWQLRKLARLVQFG